MVCKPCKSLRYFNFRIYYSINIDEILSIELKLWLECKGIFCVIMLCSSVRKKICRSNIIQKQHTSKRKKIIHIRTLRLMCEVTRREDINMIHLVAISNSFDK